MEVVGPASVQNLVKRDGVAVRIPDDTFLEETLLLHGVQQHLALFERSVIGNRHQLGKCSLGVRLLAVDRHVGGRTIHR